MKELAYKEELFFIFSAQMDKDEAIKETDRITNNFKTIYVPKSNGLKPIIGKDTYRYYLSKHRKSGWDTWYESKIEKYVKGRWKNYMFTTDVIGGINLGKLVKRLELGGNTIIEI